MLDGAAKLPEVTAAAAAAGHAGAGDDRPRQRLRRLRLLQAGHQGRRQADHRHGGLLHARLAVRPRAVRLRRQAPRRGGRRREQPRQGRVHPHDAAGPDDGGHAQPLPDLLAGQPRGPVPQAALRPRPAGALRHGPDRHDRLPVGRGQHVAARRQGGPRPPGGGGLPGHLRQGELLRRGDGPRPVDREEDQAGAAGDRQGPRHPAAGHQRPALHAQGGRAGPRRAPVHPDRLPAQRDQPLPLQRRRLLPEERRGDARAVRRHARGVRQHPARRRAVRGHVHRGRRPHAPVPAARGRGRDLLVREGGRARAAQALAERHPRPRAQAGRLRGRDHLPDGLPGVLPRGRRLHQLGQGPGHPGRARAVVRPPARWPPTPWASPTSTRWRTG